MRWLLVFAGCAQGLAPGGAPELGHEVAPDLSSAPDFATAPADLAQADLALRTSCPVAFHYAGSGGAVAVAGEFNNWMPQAMTGTSLTLPAAPGLQAYKLIV